MRYAFFHDSSIPLGPKVYTKCMNTEENDEDEIVVTKDCNGTVLANGDAVIVIKDLKVKGSSVTLKQGTKIKNIRLTDSEEEIECHADGLRNLVLKTIFLKKG